MRPGKKINMSGRTFAITINLSVTASCTKIANRKFWHCESQYPTITSNWPNDGYMLYIHRVKWCVHIHVCVLMCIYLYIYIQGYLIAYSWKINIKAPLRSHQMNRKPHRISSPPWWCQVAKSRRTACVPAVCRASCQRCFGYPWNKAGAHKNNCLSFFTVLFSPSLSLSLHRLQVSLYSCILVY